jgi:hypothetical protein
MINSDHSYGVGNPGSRLEQAQECDRLKLFNGIPTSLSVTWNRHKNVIGLNCLMGSQPVCQLLAAGCWFSQGTMILSTHKTDHHDIAEILLIVALSNNNHIVIPPLPGGGGGYTVLPLSVCPSFRRPRYFSSHFSQQLSMAEI